jgi:hypothetical protein
MPGDNVDKELHELGMDEALDNAMNALQPEAPAPESPEQATVRTLIKRSKGSFLKNIEQLEQQVRAVNRAIQQSQREKHDMIIAAEARHRAYEQEAEKDLYQIKTVMAAIELAMSVMPDE